MEKISNQTSPYSPLAYLWEKFQPDRQEHLRRNSKLGSRCCDRDR
ncbi:hypothetical protein [Scytonema sp. NUACC21]